MIFKEPIEKERIRKIQGSFGWIDHRLITEGFLEELSSSEILLYFFLITVADKNGVSFYHCHRICQLLKIDPQSYLEARQGLIEKSLIAYREGVYQVLNLPKTLINTRKRPAAAREVGLKSLREILKKLGD